LSAAAKILLQGLVLCTLVCVGLSGSPHALGGAPLQSTSIRSGQAPDSQCVVVRRTMTGDSSDSTDTRASLVGILPSAILVCPAAWRLISASEPMGSSISSRLVIGGPRARAPPVSTKS